MTYHKSGERVKGVIRINAKGFGFITPSEEYGFKQDLYVAADDTLGALSGDTVLAEITRAADARRGSFSTARSGEEKKYEARVLKIEERGKHIYSGVVYETGRGMFVDPNGLRCEGKIKICGDLTAVSPRDIITFELIRMPENYRTHRRDSDGEGKVLQVVGKDGEAGADISAIVASKGIRAGFPQEVIDEAETLPDVLPEEEIAAELKRGRRDLRDLSIVTIDSADTKDVDDGVSVSMNEKGNFVLGVHIADVTHYVKEGTPLDNEARLRGTSVYLADRVIPMLPRKLSNGICSLNTGVDRFALTVMMEINGEGTILSHEIFESVIRVEYKITYEQLFKLLDEGDGELKNRYRGHVEELGLMRVLAGILRRTRTAEGAVDFYFPETKVKLDGEGKPVEIAEYKLTFANNVIEEFMLAANKTVAEDFYWQRVPFMYRVHEAPSVDRIDEFSRIVQNLGFRLKKDKSGSVSPKNYQELMNAAEGHPFSAVISLLALRSMQKAVYLGENRGHFGLAFDFYTHFTSPIRRYPDLFIHRMIKLVISGKMDKDTEVYYRNMLPDLAKACSSAERTAEEAERESTELKVTEYMSQYIGEIFTGVVSGVTSFGIFVRLPNSAEGLVRYESFTNDYFDYNPDRLQARSERTGKTVKIGDEMDVAVVACDIPMRKIEFIPVDAYTKKHGINLKTSPVKKSSAAPGRVRTVSSGSRTSKGGKSGRTGAHGGRYSRSGGGSYGSSRKSSRKPVKRNSSKRSGKTKRR